MLPIYNERVLITPWNYRSQRGGAGDSVTHQVGQLQPCAVSYEDNGDGTHKRKLGIK